MRPPFVLVVMAGALLGSGCDGGELSLTPPTSVPALAPVPTITPFVPSESQDVMTPLPTLAPLATIKSLPTLTPVAIATPVAANTAVPLLTPLSTLTPVQSGEPATHPTPGTPVDSPGRDPSSWSTFEIYNDVVPRLQQFVLAASDQPSSRYADARATFTQACRQDGDAIAKYVDRLRALAPDSRMGLLAWHIRRIDDRRVTIDAQIVLGNYNPVTKRRRYVFSYEGDRWLNASCR